MVASSDDDAPYSLKTSWDVLDIVQTVPDSKVPDMFDERLLEVL